MRNRIVAFLALGLAASPGAAVHGEELALDWWTIDGGGTVQAASGGGYVLAGSIGQPDAALPLVGGTYQLQGGFWSGDLPATTDVGGSGSGGDGPGGSPALAFRAYGTTPNPFRVESTVSFDLPSRQPVHLVIFDPSGRVCRTLVDGDLEAGRHEKVWDGRDDQGRAVASGIYFALLETPVGQHREKVVRLR